MDFNLEQIWPLLLAAILVVTVFGAIAVFSDNANLNGIKSKQVGDGQHGTARWATAKEVQEAFLHVPFTPDLWRQGKHLPEKQGLVVGSIPRKKRTTALADTGDVHCLMIGASGVGKTAYFLYPSLEYAFASRVSLLVTDTKGDVVRNYGTIAKEKYGYRVAVIDLRNPTKSHGFNMLSLISKYADLYRNNPADLRSKSKMEKYAKICAKTLIQAGGSGDYGQNAYFYDSAEGLLASTIMLVAEFCPPEKRRSTS